MWHAATPAFPPLQSWGVPAFSELNRDTHAFGRRVGDLPLQLPGEEYDFRNLLHRDGSVFSFVDINELKQPEVRGEGVVGSHHHFLCGWMSD